MNPEITPFFLVALVCAGCVIQLIRHAHEWVGPDEAYIWYGTSRLLEGEVPLRDFRSYEPGRYLWCAPFLSVIGRGVLSIRIASYAFYCVALCIGLITLSQHGVSTLALATLAVISLTAFKECFKLYEPGLCWLWIAAATVLLSHPSNNGYLTLGLVVGLAATFGVNLGLYSTLASFVVLGWLLFHGFVRSAGLPVFVGGVALGALPLLAYVILARDFVGVLLERRLFAVMRRGATNMPLPVPWPWKTGKGSDRPTLVLAMWTLGMMFILLPLIPLVTLVLFFRPGTSMNPMLEPALFGAAVLALFICQHAFSRADVEHVYHSHIPATVTLALWADRWGHGRLVFAACLVWLVLWYGGLGRVLRRPRRATPESYVSNGWRLDGEADQVSIVRGVEAQLATVSPESRDELVAVPWMLWVLPILNLQSAVYDTYCTYTGTREEQDRMMREIAHSPAELVLIDTGYLDDDPERAFARTHPLVMEWITDNCEVVECGMPGGIALMRKTLSPRA